MKNFLIGSGVVAVLVVSGVILKLNKSKPVLPPPSPYTTSSNTTQNAPSPSPTSASSTSYKDGTYIGNSANAYYGNVKVATTISGGKIVDVKFVTYPTENQTSTYINQQAIVYLKQEVLKAQSSNVQLISGATFTSQAFVQSLASALKQA